MEIADIKKVEKLDELLDKGRETGVSGVYLDDADDKNRKMRENIQARDLLDKLSIYPDRIYPEPEIIDPKKKVKKEDEKKKKKRKKREPPFIFPEWATELEVVVKEVNNLTNLVKKAEDIRLDQEFVDQVHVQLARFKKEIWYRKKLEEDAKREDEERKAKRLAAKKKKK